MRKVRYLGPSAAVTLPVAGRVTRGSVVELDESVAKQKVATGKWEYADEPEPTREPVAEQESSPTPDSNDDDEGDLPQRRFRRFGR